VCRRRLLLAELGGFQRVAVIHDWLTGMRGGEKVLEAILELFPRSELFTLFHFPGTVSPQIESHPIHVSFLQRLASRIEDYRRLLPLFPMAAESFDLSSFDLVISSSHCVANGVNARRARHVSYCHTPMRYIWDRFDDYFPPRRPLLRFVANVAAPPLRRWDVRTARRVDLFVANSHFVQERIARFYGREARVIHPFVDAAFLARPLEVSRSDYHVVLSALVPYKRVEIAVQAARETGIRLLVIGSGPSEAALRRQAAPNVEFLGFVSTEVLIQHLQRARSLILPGIEDFGISCLEAMACGTPVVAHRAGGVLDSVADGVTGVLFDRQTVESLSEVLTALNGMAWDHEAIRRHAARFSRERFLREFSAAVTGLAEANVRA